MEQSQPTAVGGADDRAPGPAAAGLVRSWSAPLRLALTRARARPGRGFLAAAGMACATAMLAAVVGAGAVAGEQSLRQALAGLPADQRAFRLTWPGAPPQAGYGALDRRAMAALAALDRRRPVRTVLFRDATFAGATVSLGAADGLSRYVRLRSGRMPRTCTPQRCEVVQVGAAGPSQVHGAGVLLVRVGVGALTSPLPFGPVGNAAASDSGRSPPLLLGSDVAALSAADGLSSIYRTYGWATPVAPGDVHRWEIDGLLAREARVESRLSGPQSLFRMTGPDQALLGARDRGRAAARRLTLVGGTAAALLLAFVLLTAEVLRRDVDGEVGRLRRRGARLGQIWLFVLADTGWITAAGAAVGVVAGLAAVALIARGTGLAAGPLLTNSLLSWSGARLGLLWWLGASLLLVAALRWPAGEIGLGRFRAVDGIAVTATVALLVGAARGSVGVGSLSGGSSDPLLPLLPLLACVVAGVVVARMLPPLMRAGERAARRGPPALRLALISLGRDPGPAALACAFLVVCLGLSVFADGYRSTLSRGQRDQAAFAVPVTAIVRGGPQLVPPLQAASLAAYRTLPGDRTAWPVLRSFATAPASGGRPADVTVLGIPADGVAGLAWRPDYSFSTQAALARLLRPAGAVALRGAELPRGARRLLLRTVGRPPGLALALAVQARGGRFVPVALHASRVGGELTAVLPPSLRGGRVVGLDIGLGFASTQAAVHRAAEGGSSANSSGTFALGPLRAGGSVVTDWSGWVARGQLEAGQGAGGTVALRYVLGEGGRALLRPTQPTDDVTLPVVVSPDIAAAASDGRLTLRFSLQTVAAKVVAVARRFPTVDQGSFAVADAAQLSTVLNADAPGTGVPGEVWLQAGASGQGALGAALRRPPFDPLAVTTRDAVERALLRDPLAVGILRTLAAAAVVALALAGAGLLLAVAGTLRDERAALFDLEAQGVGPRVLRSEMRLRALLVGVVGLLGGLLLGMLLSAWTVSVVSLTAGLGTPQPPLLVAISWSQVLAGGATFAVLTAAGVAAVTRRSFRGPAPARPRGLAP